MPKKADLLECELNLPKHDDELAKAEEVIENIKLKLRLHGHNKTITDCTHTAMYEEIARILDYVGQLSVPAFEAEPTLEELYYLRYKHSPALGKELFWRHYDQIHKPYTLLKNRCFRLFEELDKCYKTKFKKNPPNWNI